MQQMEFPVEWGLSKQFWNYTKLTITTLSELERIMAENTEAAGADALFFIIRQCLSSSRSYNVLLIRSGFWYITLLNIWLQTSIISTVLHIASTIEQSKYY